MASDWHGYWNDIPGGLASFTLSMLVPPMSPAFFVDGTPTTFLLFSKRNHVPLKAWTGRVYDIERHPPSPRIGFRVKVGREMKFPARYATLAGGWYVEDPEPPESSYGLW